MEPAKKEFVKEVVIVNELGLHARSAAQIASLARQAKSNVWIFKGDQRVDATSIIDILTLAAARGTKIILKVNDGGDLEILETIVALVENGFGEQSRHE